MSPVLSPLLASLSFSALDICFQGEVIVSCLCWLSDTCRTVLDFRARSPLFDWRLIVEQVYWRFWPNWRKFYHIYSRSRRQFLCWFCNLLSRCDTETSLGRAVAGMLSDCLSPYYCYNLLSLPLPPHRCSTNHHRSSLPPSQPNLPRPTTRLSHTGSGAAVWGSGVNWPTSTHGDWPAGVIRLRINFPW